ncbi:MAG: 2,3-bisphosphoglycerate-independent phosphoglycerate mutase [Deltaproteobacteria bacterium]|nr:2,3-bisphosphoglycerate-independent phosphoglycerate mutase [Deltaproteobacteria bacterium]
MVKPVVLVVMDGWGIAPPGPHNAVHLGRTEVLDRLQREWPSTELAAHGPAVGLPDDQMGNSEVGHLNLGAGRVVKQELVLIDDAVKDGSYRANPVFKSAAERIRVSGGRAHLMGLCSPGCVHSSLEHLYALVDLLAKSGLEVYLHAITDGRDTPPSSARGYLQEIEARLEGKARVAVVVGRYWSMDRDKRWDRVARGYRAHTQGIGSHHGSADEGIAAAYEAGETDEFITPRVMVDDGGEPLGRIEDGDGVFFFNFRADRAREMTQALTGRGFEDGFFEREVVRDLGAYVCMTEYRSDFGLPIAFAPHTLDQILGQVLADKGLKQLRSAETEKYAHVTFFFNGGVEQPFPAEDRHLVPSPKEVATYDLKPEMSAAGVTDHVVECIASGEHDFILVNYANGDMVGHTGILDAAIAAVETVDAQIGRLEQAIANSGGAMLITADHGNSEQMRDKATGQPHTAHTLNPVPLILVDPRYRDAKLRLGGSLSDVAPTVLALLGLPQPPEMTGSSLIE